MDAAVSIRRRRALAQGLAAPLAGGPAAIAAHLLAVQAQDLREAGRALRARAAPGLTRVHVDAALTEERALVRTWLARGTLHLVAAEDLPWLHALLGGGRLERPALRRLAQEGIAPGAADRAVGLLDGRLADEGPQTRAELAAWLATRDVPVAGQRIVHLLALAAARGVLVFGPLREGMHAAVRPADWLGTPRGPAPAPAPAGAARERALAELGRRYLAGHAPADAADLARWSGLGLVEARRALAGAGPLPDAPAPRRALPPRLLPAFDPYLLGWRDRAFAVPAAHARAVHPAGGILRAVLLVDGAVAGTWSARRQGTALAVELAPFAELTATAARALRAEAAAVRAFEATDPAAPRVPA